MRKLLTLLLPLCVMTTWGQDVIVKRDGSIIQSKVIKIGTTEVEYKKFSNQGGPTYSILKSDVLAINYENGEKDTFADVQQPMPNSQTAQASGSSAFGVNPNLADDNLKLVREFNSLDPVYIGDDKQKKATFRLYVLGLKEGSIIETPEIKASSIKMKAWYGKVSTFGHAVLEERTVEWDAPIPYANNNMQYRIAITLKNKTNKPIYIDLANSYVLQNEQAKPYYVPTATTSSHGGSSGGSVNLGAVASAIGVGGTAGNLASGINVGGSSTNVSTKTTYSQRVVSIPPMSSLSLDPMDIGQGATWVTASKREWDTSFLDACRLKDYLPEKLMRGEVVYSFI